MANFLENDDVVSEAITRGNLSETNTVLLKTQQSVSQSETRPLSYMSAAGDINNSTQFGAVLKSVSMQSERCYVIVLKFPYESKKSVNNKLHSARVASFVEEIHSIQSVRKYFDPEKMKSIWIWLTSHQTENIF
jgi:hypothetical protein